VCQNEPCLNQGICKPNETFYTCTCTNHYFGPVCQYYKNPAFPQSKILTNKNLVDTLYNLTGFQSKQFSMIYQASKDGFRSVDFHSKCDNISDTLTLIKTTKSYIFGGYTMQTWEMNKCYSNCFKSDLNSFLISLLNSQEKAIRLNVSETSTAIDSFFEYGPSFGKGDIFIANLSNKNVKSSAEPSSSYSLINEKSIIYDSNLLAGEKYFQTSEIETYQII